MIEENYEFMNYPLTSTHTYIHTNNCNINVFKDPINSISDCNPSTWGEIELKVILHRRKKPLCYIEDPFFKEGREGGRRGEERRREKWRGEEREREKERRAKTAAGKKLSS